MGFAFNPFTGNFDLTGSGGGASYIDGEEAVYGDLSLDAGVAPLNSAWLVRGSSGIWPFNKPGGIYIRTATGGSSRDADYTYAGTMPDVFSDAVLTIYDEASTTRTGQFNLGSVTAGQNRVLTWPNANGTIARTEDFASPPAIGNTTAAAANFTTVGATGIITGANTTASPPTTTTEARGLQFASLGGTFGNTAAIYGSHPSTAALGIGIANSSAGSITQVAAFTSTGLNSCAIGATTASTVAATTLNATGTTELVNGGTTAGPFRLYNTSTSATNFERLNLRWASNVAIIGTEKGSAGGSARALEFQTDGTTRINVGTTGNVGIGTTSPSRLLHLNAPAVAGTREGLFKGSTSDSGNDAFYIGNATNGDGRFVAAFQAYVDSVNSVYSQAFWGMTSAANDASDSSTFGLTHVAAMRTSSATDPTNGTLTDIVNRKVFTIGGATSNIFFTVAAGGNVGIGTTSPTAKLHVDGTVLFNGAFTIQDANNIAVGTTTGTKIGTATNQKIGFFNATPVVQQAAVADATDAASTQARLNDLLARLRTLGLIAT